MRIGHIVSTMNNHDVTRLVKKMNLNIDSIIVNQTDAVKLNIIEIDGSQHDVYSFNEKGVGLSRNNGLIRSNFDITIISDDDMEYINDYEKIVKNAYVKYSDADMIVFNVRIHEDGKIWKPVKKNGRVRLLNSLKYGAVTFTFKTDSIRKKNIHFSLLFGGGAKYSNGEDSLFIWDCVKAGLKIYSVNLIIADVYNDDSSWFQGYTNQFFKDRGALFASLTKTWGSVLCLQFAIRKKKMFLRDKTWFQAFKLMIEGMKEFKNGSEVA